MTRTPLPATLSLDLDNQWAYMRVHGDSGWEDFPSYLPRVIPRILRLLESKRLTITFFIVGQDAALEKNRNAFAALAAAGHEMASHSFSHLPSLAQQPEPEIEDELARAEDAIERATGRRPRGFRGPAFSLSRNLLRVLKRRAYGYDASTFPTFIGPLARAYYQATVKHAANGAAERQNLYGGWRDGLRPIHPYFWRLPEGGLLEIPVTTFPLCRLPIHLTYLLHCAGFSPALALQYFRAALKMCAATRTPPSLLLHPLDFLGKDDVPELAFFPGMSLPRGKKTEFVARVLDELCARFAPAPLAEFAMRHADRAALSPSGNMKNLPT